MKRIPTTDGFATISLKEYDFLKVKLVYSIPASNIYIVRWRNINVCTHNHARKIFHIADTKHVRGPIRDALRLIAREQWALAGVKAFSPVTVSYVYTKKLVETKVK